MSAPAVARRVPCKLCGKAIIWGVKPDGGKVPLDPVPPVFYASTPEVSQIHGHPRGTVSCSQAVKIGNEVDGEKLYPDAMVSHFVTCPNVADLKRRGKVTNAEQAAELVEKGEQPAQGELGR